MGQGLCSDNDMLVLRVATGGPRSAAELGS